MSVVAQTVNRICPYVFTVGSYEFQCPYLSILGDWLLLIVYSVFLSGRHPNHSGHHRLYNHCMV